MGCVERRPEGLCSRDPRSLHTTPQGVRYCLRGGHGSDPPGTGDRRSADRGAARGCGGDGRREQRVRYLSPTQEPALETEGQKLTERRERVVAGSPSHDIAVIGMAGRFPGARTPEELWQNLVAGVDAISFYSEAQLRAAGVSPAEFR